MPDKACHARTRTSACTCSAQVCIRAWTYGRVQKVRGCLLRQGICTWTRTCSVKARIGACVHMADLRSRPPAKGCTAVMHTHCRCCTSTGRENTRAYAHARTPPPNPPNPHSLPASLQIYKHMCAPMACPASTAAAPVMALPSRAHALAAGS